MKFLLLIAALTATCTALAQEASEAILDYTDDLGAFVNVTVGWTFQTSTTLTVTSLGCFADVFVNNLGLNVSFRETPPHTTARCWHPIPSHRAAPSSTRPAMNPLPQSRSTPGKPIISEPITLAAT